MLKRRLKFLTLHNAVKFGICSCLLVNLVLLIYRPPLLSEHICPIVIADSTKWTRTAPRRPERSSLSEQRPVHCGQLYNDTLRPDVHIEWCQRRDAISAEDYSALTENCESFRKFRGYDFHSTTQEEREFPIAFSIMMHEDVEQTERLLRAIYRPHNVYCVHVDAKSPSTIHRAMASIANCLPNVFMASRSVGVRWAEFSVLEAELVCLGDIWPKTWSYYMNLAGREFPLKTNRELVQILKSYQGGNEVDGSPNKRPRDWTDYSWRTEYWRTGQRKPPAPHGFTVSKGSTHVAVSRAFVDYALHDQKARDLLEWMRDIRCPDEHFFPTLNNNPHLGVPGAYTGNPDLRDGFYVRYKLWQNPAESCHGKWVHFICVLGSGDVSRLLGTKHMFVNKLNLDLDPVAFQCVEELYFKRLEMAWNLDFDVDFYKSRKLVKQHVS